MQIVQTKVAQFDTCMSSHCILSLKLNNYKGIPLLDEQGEYPPLRGGQNTPRQGAGGINSKINTVSTQVKLYNGHPSILCRCKYSMKEYKCTYMYIFICI